MSSSPFFLLSSNQSPLARGRGHEGKEKEEERLKETDLGWMQGKQVEFDLADSIV